jgi:hypothetical protein
MTRIPCPPLAGAVLLAATSGCAAQLAAATGVSVSEERPTHVMWQGSASGSYIGSGAVGPRFGAELTGRHEYDDGTRWSAGVQAGVIQNPSESQPVGGGAHVDFGTPLTEPALFPDGDFYAGATGELIFWLGGQRGPNELNAAPWLLVSQPELVLRAQVRGHHHFDDDPAIGHLWTLDANGGVAMRIRFITEYF